MISSFEMSAIEYQRFCHLLEDRCGIVLGDNRQYLVVSRLRHIMEDKKIKNFYFLLKFLENDNKLLMQVIDAMTTNETLWFRDEYPYTIFRERILPDLWELDRPLRVWSSACSTGQEPYSLGMEIEDYQINRSERQHPVKIIASDISNSVLDHAKEGKYSSASLLRGITSTRRDHHFSKTEDDHWQISSNVSKRIRFQNTNLTEDFNYLGKFDVIFCRNVLFYFSVEMRYNILERMHALLNPGGYLMLGASDITFTIDDLFDKTACHPGMMYQAKQVAATR